MNKDALGDRMKLLERYESGRQFTPLLPICVRLDGKCFSTLTKGLKRPYDERLSHLMINVTGALVSMSNAIIGYTQSDEISLILYSDSYNKQVYFDGKIQKIVSVLASAASVMFSSYLKEVIPEKGEDAGLFDCRAWVVPTKMEAVNTLVWRELDAIKNSVSMAARFHYAHKELHSKNREEMLDMLMRKGVNWNDYPTHFKRGTYVKRQLIKKATRLNDIFVNRHIVAEYLIPPLSKLSNKEEVIFEGAAPATLEVV
ncbi:MAG TPA: tRNA(His) guanylyltransferase Thg1 family protein [Patescibacteria group bacterium]|nr:tRNA(His) guanylyltransferase Thg1 family protein [Patescibacteria group bacterium]